jgi:hypothetical protein
MKIKIRLKLICTLAGASVQFLETKFKWPNLSFLVKQYPDTTRENTFHCELTLEIQTEGHNTSSTSIFIVNQSLHYTRYSMRTYKSIGDLHVFRKRKSQIHVGGLKPEILVSWLLDKIAATF